MIVYCSCNMSCSACRLISSNSSCKHQPGDCDTAPGSPVGNVIIQATSNSMFISACGIPSQTFDHFLQTLLPVAVTGGTLLWMVLATACQMSSYQDWQLQTASLMPPAVAAVAAPGRHCVQQQHRGRHCGWQLGLDR